MGWYAVNVGIDTSLVYPESVICQDLEIQWDIYKLFVDLGNQVFLLRVLLLKFTQLHYFIRYICLRTFS